MVISPKQFRTVTAAFLKSSPMPTALGPRQLCTHFQVGTTAVLLTKGGSLWILLETCMERLTMAAAILGLYSSWCEARTEAGARRQCTRLWVRPMVAP